LDEIQTKILRFFLLAIQSHLYSFALKFLFLQAHATFFMFYSVLLYTVKEKGGKPDRKPHPLPYDLRNPYRNLKSEMSKKYGHEFGLCMRSKFGIHRSGRIVLETENTRVPLSKKERLRIHRSGTYRHGINII
jgi:hypothetical protein